MKGNFTFRNKKLKEMVDFLLEHPNEYTTNELANQFGLTYDQAQKAVRRGKQKYTLVVKTDYKKGKKRTVEDRKSFAAPKRNTERVLIIGDLHEPFTLEGYLEFCKKVYKEYKCTHVIFIGDIVDNHAISYHESDADGMSAGDELDIAIDNIAKWYEAFPSADVIIGNHDRLIMRKAFTGGIPRRWIMGYQDMFGVPTWDFSERKVYNNVQYIHGEGGTARNRCKKDLMSTVQGHLHTQAYCEHLVGATFHIFGMQVGCGVDHESYAMAYAKNFGKPVIGVSVVINSGGLPINILMPL